MTTTTMLHIIASLLGHAADSPTLSHFPLSSVPDREEPVLTQCPCALAELNATRMCKDLWYIYQIAPSKSTQYLCTLGTYMVKGNIPSSNSRTLRTPLDGDRRWERPHSPRNQTLQTTFQEVSPTPLQCPLRMMCKRCARKGEQT